MKVSNLQLFGFVSLILAGVGICHPGSAEDHHEERMQIRDISHCAEKLAIRNEAILAKRQTQNTFGKRAQSQEMPKPAIAKRSLAERSIYSTIQNETCVINPEVTQGPYFIDGELNRRDVRKDTEGVDLWLDVGVINIDTCEPLEEVYLDFWHCNNEGRYSGYYGINPDTMQVDDGYTEADDGTTDQKTFLRGFQKSNSEGIVEFLSKFPGFYQPRSIHIHLQAHVNASVAENGTLVSDGTIHTGQLFFDEDLSTQVLNTEAYLGHDQSARTKNEDDMVFPQSNTTGWNPVVQVVQLGENVEDGLLGYITIGVSPNGNTTTSDEGMGSSGGGDGGSMSGAPSVSGSDSSMSMSMSDGIGGGMDNTVPTVSLASDAYASAQSNDAVQLSREAASSTMFAAAFTSTEAE